MIGLAVVCPLALAIGWGIVRTARIGAADEPPAAVRAVDEPPAAVRAADAVPAGGATAWASAVPPKPLSDQVKKGLAWLVEHQGRDGGWGQGEEAPGMRGSNRDALRDTPNVADTCIAALALIRSGSTPTSGPHKDAVAAAVRFVEQNVEASDSASSAVTTVQGTRVQQKLGPNIDTFLASMLLAEVKGRMGDEAADRRAVAALDKVLDKIRRHQKDDGSFDGQGWAPILAQAMCGKGINRARQAGANVPEIVIARAENGAKMGAFGMFSSGAVISADSYEGAAAPAAGLTSTVTSRRMTATPPPATSPARGDAGVELYSRAAHLGVLQDSVNTSKAEAAQLNEQLRAATDPKARDRAAKRLGEIADTEKVHRQAQEEIVNRLDDKGFVAGFGSNGGEEFLSYMNIAESLVVKGGDPWKRWDESMAANLQRVQNDDGSWTGHHCITGRTFCTSAALLVLMADRTPIPAGANDGPKPEVR
jgi:hypothetical protein